MKSVNFSCLKNYLKERSWKKKRIFDFDVHVCEFLTYIQEIEYLLKYHADADLLICNNDIYTSFMQNYSLKYLSNHLVNP